MGSSNSGFSGWEFHKYEINGRYILYDVNSAQYFSVERIAYRVLDYIKDHTRNDIVNILAHEFSEEAILDVMKELEGYRKKKLLFMTKRKLPPIKSIDLSPLSKLTINVANDCNLRCTYCWNLYGTYGYKPHLMDKDTAIKAVDFLYRRSGDTKQLHLNFYGGEPLLNFEILKLCSEYALNKARSENKEITFSVNTNATLLDDEIICYLEEKKFTVNISVDGKKDYHNSVRNTGDGRGTWDTIISAVQKISTNERSRLGIRATLLPPYTDLLDTVRYLDEIGMKNVEVAYAGELQTSRNEEQRKGVKGVDREKERGEYIRYALGYLDSVLHGSPKGWFDQKIWNVYHTTPKFYGCSVEIGNQIAIDAFGNIYPCLVFTGKREYLLGNVGDKDLKTELFVTLQNNRVDAREVCKDCWARFLCGGGCIAENSWYHKDISIPDMTNCDRLKYEFETVMWLISELQEKAPDFFNNSIGENKPEKRLKNCSEV